ncbi:MAG: uracil phosphoribosyltransferase [Bacilli bacterium]|nr:uracil phosphoribosyltransferase [Bacilli bacterium]
MNLKQYPNVHVSTHPLLKHKITIIRNKETRTALFREIVNEIASLEGYEVFRNLKTKNIHIETPLEKTTQPMVDLKKICVVPILRAGLGMVEGLIKLVPEAKVGYIGIYRNEKTHKPVEYLCKLPKNIKQMEVFLIDPMLATGGSAIDAISTLKKHGAKKINFICIVAAPEGVKAFCKKYPDVTLYIGALDRKLNKNKYILPGLGDAGDRIHGTED